jgi:beta-N-acetylhexosaminidase
MILMPYQLESAINGIETAVNSGDITEERIEESVLRILKVKLEAGIIEN